MEWPKDHRREAWQVRLEMCRDLVWNSTVPWDKAPSLASASLELLIFREIEGILIRV